MRPIRLSRLTVWLPVLVALVVTAGRVSAQCAITGPSEVCGEAVTLCAPDGEEVYEWTLPDGSQQFTQCITVTDPGTYSLRFIDPAVGTWSTPCTRTLSPNGPAPVITGPASGCTGSSVQLCGPSGDFVYQWAGPNGLGASTACVDLSASGTWMLRVHPMFDGCWSAWATQTVTFSTCSDPEPSPSPSPSPSPDPGPQPPVPNCPRAAWWWAQQCPDHDRSQQRLDASLVGSIAACVASHDTDLDGSLCGTMLAGHRTLRMRARRQVAAVWANVCAGALGVTTSDGRPVSLDGAAVVSLPEFQGTVNAWLQQAATTVSAMGASSGKSAKKAEDEACRKLIRVAWQVNHGIGVGPVCPPPGHEVSAAPASMESGIAFADPEPLAAELIDDFEASLAFGAIQPNPFKTRMAMAYVLTTTSPADVTIGVYDISGRLVRELVNGPVTPGSYVTTWDGLDASGVLVRGGLYFVLGRVGGERVQSRVTFVR